MEHCLCQFTQRVGVVSDYLKRTVDLSETGFNPGMVLSGTTAVHTILDHHHSVGWKMSRNSPTYTNVLIFRKRLGIGGGCWYIGVKKKYLIFLGCHGFFQWTCPRVAYSWVCRGLLRKAGVLKGGYHVDTPQKVANIWLYITTYSHLFQIGVLGQKYANCIPNLRTKIEELHHPGGWWSTFVQLINILGVGHKMGLIIGRR